MRKIYLLIYVKCAESSLRKTRRNSRMTFSVLDRSLTHILTRTKFTIFFKSTTSPYERLINKFQQLNYTCDKSL